MDGICEVFADHLSRLGACGWPLQLRLQADATPNARARFWASAPSRVASGSVCAVVAHQSPDKPSFPVLQKR